MASEKKFDAYQMVTDTISDMLDKGVVPWVRPWSSVSTCAWSRSTGRQYSLVNQILLGGGVQDGDTLQTILSRAAGEWLTYNQAQDLGGQVRKGERGRKVVFFKPWQRDTGKQDDNGDEIIDTIPVLRCYTVFRVDQVNGIEQKYNAQEVAHSIPEDADAESVAADYLRRSGVTYSQVRGNDAYYSPALDLVVTPLREQFGSQAEYYSTLYHELTHSTGRQGRLNRLTDKAAFGDGVYSTEELVAEIGSASILATLGIGTDDSLRNSAAYCQNWLKALKGDKKMFVVAAARAEKALGMIFGV